MTEERYINLHRGSPPWEPGQGADLVYELNHYDMPLSGVLLQAGALYLFRCVAGQVEPVSSWVYTEISTAEGKEIQSLALSEIPDEAFDAAIEELFSERHGTMAVAVHGFGLVAFRRYPADIGEEDFNALVTDMYDEFDSSLGSLKREGSRQQDLVRQLVS